ncbi:MAG: hypothetical protein ACREH5_08170 [Candidatus Omnitrophota bacterium]
MKTKIFTEEIGRKKILELIGTAPSSQAKMPDSVWAKMPYSVWANMPDSFWAKMPYSVWANMPYSFWAKMPYNRKKIFDDVPVVEKPYSKTLASIKAGGCLDMSSVHDGNICGTKHCQAGWLIFHGGEAGKKLQEKYDWALAATLIAVKNAPGQPLPNFEVLVPNEAALAFIEARVEAGF